MDRKDIIRRINKYTIEDDQQNAINLLCELMNHEERKKYMDLIYILIDSFQLYGYTKSLNLENFKNHFGFASFEYKLESYKGDYIQYLNNGQLSLIETIKEEDKMIISAPTSFGKTSILIEYILNNYLNLNNIIFIVPTNSLIEELYIKFLNINKQIGFQYNITVNIKNFKGKTIRILTPERFLTFYEYNGINNQDLIVMDETYKIESSKDLNYDVVDNRAFKFRKVLEVIGKSNKKVVMLSPYTYNKDNSMKEYMKKYNIKEENRKKKYVEHIYHNLTNVTDFNKCFSSQNVKYKDYNNINKKVLSILEALKGEENVVYINNPSKAIEIIKLIKGNIADSETIEDERYKVFLKHLKDTYNTDGINEWYIITALKLGIGVYVSSMPRYIKREIVNLFEKGIIKTLIVTTAFIEGVNSTAKNIIITSGSTGGNVKLNEMSLLNIAGRAGRFGNKYIGHVFFIDNDTYRKVDAVKDSGVSLSNPNYKNNDLEQIRNDYEIEMIDNKYLNDLEIERKQKIKEKFKESNLTYEEVNNICISVPAEWKRLLYDYFKINNNKIDEYRQNIDDVLLPDSENVLKGITDIFYILRDAGIPFYNNFSDIYPFKRNGEFLWGTLYQQHANGNIKKVLISKKMYILSEKIKMPRIYFKKTWMKKYFDKDWNFLDNKLYEETFKFISNIIEYKIPYYITFFASMFKYYIENENIELENNEISLVDEIDKIGNIGIDEKVLIFYDYGFPKEMIDKIANLEKPINMYNMDELKEFDEYEKIMIKEFIEIMY